MEKLDLAKQYKTYYSAKAKPQVLDIQRAQFLSIKGKGDPSGKEFADKLQALYATAYCLKFMCKASGKDFVVAKLEAIWSFDEQRYGNVSITDAPVKIPRNEWIYRLMIRMPEYVTQQQVVSAIDSVTATKNILLAAEIELFSMTEGKVLQMLHIGPFDTEPETLQLIHEFIVAHGLKRNGLHNEIYLSDFRKTAPDKLRTILREPVTN